MVASAVNVLGVLIFLFLFWKKLKEDYASQIIFSSAFLVLSGAVLGFIVSWQLFPSYFFWAWILGSGIGLTIAILRFKIRVFESFEACVLGFLPLFSLVFLRDSVMNTSLTSFFAFLVVLFLIFIYFVLNANYRKFSWYKSGRAGFAGLATLALLFLIRSSVAIFHTSVLSFVGKGEVFLSGTLTFMCFLLLYNLSRQT